VGIYIYKLIIHTTHTYIMQTQTFILDAINRCPPLVLWLVSRLLWMVSREHRWLSECLPCGCYSILDGCYGVAIRLLGYSVWLLGCCYAVARLSWLDSRVLLYGC